MAFVGRFLGGFAAVTGASLFSNYVYSVLTAFKREMTVEEKQIHHDCTLKMVLGDRYTVSDGETTYNPRRFLWSQKPVLNEEGVYFQMRKGDKYNIQGYGISFPNWHIYPNITHVERVPTMKTHAEVMATLTNNDSLVYDPNLNDQKE